MSVPQRNSSVTSDWPARETERTSRTLRMMLTASSMGRVTSVSTSSGAAPGSSVRIVIVGYERSGSRFSLSRESDTKPNSAIATVNITIVTRRLIAKSIRDLSMGVSPRERRHGASVRRLLRVGFLRGEGSRRLGRAVARRPSPVSRS